MSAPERIVPAGHEHLYNQWHLSPAVRHGGVVHCSGVIGLRHDGTLPEDPSGQVRQAFANLAEVLAAAGLGLDDLIDLHTFHLDLASEVPAFIAVRDEVLREPWPAWTAIGVTGLGGGLPGVVLEMRATAASR